MTAQDILKMIENVGDVPQWEHQNDMKKYVAALNEIDARVWCMVDDHGWKFEELKKFENSSYCIVKLHINMVFPCPQYTRSRDALKKIRPPEWKFTVDHRIGNGKERFKGWKFCGHAWKHKGEYDKLGTVYSYTDKNFLPTEELAELHALIQALEHDRGQK